MNQVHNACIVGAGFISLFHIEALKSLPNVRIAGVCDPDKRRAAALAARWAIPNVYGSIDELIASDTCDVAHVLVPADLHRKTAEPLLRAGINVLAEKPLAVSADDCEALIAAASDGKAILGVNHNSTFRPAFLKVKEILNSGQVGNLRHVISHLNVPLRQLGAKQFGHWMFQLPQNIFLEQGVHPLSQIYDLVGNPTKLSTLTSGRHELAPGVEIFDTWQVSLVCERGTAQLLLSVGQDFPSWQLTAICQDGTVQADFLHERCVIQGRTRDMDFLNSFRTGMRIAASTAAQSIKGASGYVLSQLKVIPKTDPFIVSINNAVAAFYQGLDRGGSFPDARTGRDVMRICEQIVAPVARVTPSPAMPSPEFDVAGDALIIGGTGFIGSALVRKMLAAGLKVRVLARNTNTLPELFHEPGVTVIRGSITDPEAINKAIAGVTNVIHLAHGGGGDSWDEIERSMVGGTRVIAEACLRHKVRRLVYIGTLASMYLGNPSATITGASGNDPQYVTRGLYSRGKAVCEALLEDLHREQSLPVVILRPGVVVGDGGTVMHSGIGFFNQDTHMLGWNKGRNPLPFVLVEDCAQAAFNAAMANGIEGKAYNVVGDVRLNASEYMKEMALATGRPYTYYSQSVVKLQLIEIGKWIIKRMTGRKDAAFPSYRDLKSRGLVASFDTSDIKHDLGWRPVSDRTEFIRAAIEVHRKV